jgi:serine/threonine-protein kinase
VVKELRTTLLGGAPDSEASGEAKAEVAAAAQGRGTNPEAHRLFLEGRHFIDRLSDDGMARGVELLERATTLDPENALAWAELGRAYWSQGAWGYTGIDEGVAKARAAIQRALELAPGLPEALVLRAWIEGSYEFDLVGAEASLREAYDRAPSNPAAIDALGQFLSRTGRYEEGERLLLQAVELDPLSARTLGSLASFYRVTGRFEESIATMRTAIALSPDRISVRHLLGLALALTGRLEEALEETMRERADWARLTGLASILWKAGRHAESDAALAELIATHADDSAFQVAAVYVWRGDKDAAFEWIDRAIRNRDAGAVAAPTEVAFRSLHGDPRWKGVLERLGFAHLPLFKEQTG